MKGKCGIYKRMRRLYLEPVVINVVQERRVQRMHFLEAVPQEREDIKESRP